MVELQRHAFTPRRAFHRVQERADPLDVVADVGNQSDIGDVGDFGIVGRPTLVANLEVEDSVFDLQIGEFRAHGWRRFDGDHMFHVQRKRQAEAACAGAHIDPGVAFECQAEQCVKRCVAAATRVGSERAGKRTVVVAAVRLFSDAFGLLSVGTDTLGPILR